MFTFLKTVLNDNPSLLKLNFYFGLDFPFDFSLDFPLADWSASGTPSQIAKGMVSSPNCLELLYIFKIMSWRDKEKYLGLLNQFPQRDWDELHRCFSMSRCLKVTGCRRWPVTIYPGHRRISWYTSPPHTQSDLVPPDSGYSICVMADELLNWYTCRIQSKQAQRTDTSNIYIYKKFLATQNFIE